MSKKMYRVEVKPEYEFDSGMLKWWINKLRGEVSHDLIIELQNTNSATMHSWNGKNNAKTTWTIKELK